MTDYTAAVAAMRTPLSETLKLSALVRYATLAPNGHNTQPWRFRQGANGIDILPDVTRRTPAVDPDDHHLFVSLGCATENLALAASGFGRPGNVGFDPSGAGSVRFTFGGSAAAEPALVDAILKRQSTRTLYDGREVSSADLRLLAAAATSVPGVDLVLLTDRSDLSRVVDLVVAGNNAQMADPAFLRELKSWMRFNPGEALAKGDGLFSATSGNPVVPTWLGRKMFDLLFRAKSEDDRYARQIRSSAGVAVFVSQTADPDHWVRTGRACQRFALQATALGLKHAFINQPVEVAALRPDLAALVGMSGRRPDIVMRFGYGGLAPYSARRPVQDVIV